MRANSFQNSKDNRITTKYIFAYYSCWSESFSLDTIEDAGKVSCKRSDGAKKDAYQVGVHIAMSKTDTLTKIITFTPFYMVQNSVGKGVDVEVFEAENPEKVTRVEAGETRPFWPDHGATRVKIRVVGTPVTSETEAFSLQKPRSTLLMLNDSKFGGLHAEVEQINKHDDDFFSESFLILFFFRSERPTQKLC